MPAQTKYSLEPVPECSVNSQARRAMLPAQAKSTFVFPGNLPLHTWMEGEMQNRSSYFRHHSQHHVSIAVRCCLHWAWLGLHNSWLHYALWHSQTPNRSGTAHMCDSQVHMNGLLEIVARPFKLPNFAWKQTGKKACTNGPRLWQGRLLTLYNFRQAFSSQECSQACLNFIT